MGKRIDILSDASAEIAEVWPVTPLAALVDTAMFSCREGATKPDPRLYRRLLAELGIPPAQALYIGDGGGDELRGATDAGMTGIAVRRRGKPNALAFGATNWSGRHRDAVEDVPAYLADLS